MTTTTQPGTNSRLCSVYSRASGEDPGGTAPSWDRCLVVELAKPWKHDVSESRHFPAGVSDALDMAEKAGRPTRLQCVAPDPDYSREGLTRVMLFSRPPGPVTTYDKDDFVAPPDLVAALVRALLVDTDRLEEFEQYRHRSGNVREMLVCTHGARDTCCASFGFPIYQLLRHQYAPELDGRLRVWRVSHLGGHRLAPNVVDLPEGRNWVRLEPQHLDALVYRKRPVSEMRRFYRGWIALGTPYEQMAEREVFMREGWDWTNRQVTTHLEGQDSAGGRSTVRIDFADRNGGPSGSYEATVEDAPAVPTMECLAEAESGLAEQYAVSGLVRLR